MCAHEGTAAAVAAAIPEPPLMAQRKSGNCVQNMRNKRGEGEKTVHGYGWTIKGKRKMNGDNKERESNKNYT